MPSTKSVFLMNYSNISTVSPDTRVYVHISNAPKIPLNTPVWFWASNPRWSSFFAVFKGETFNVGHSKYMTAYFENKDNAETAALLSFVRNMEYYRKKEVASVEERINNAKTNDAEVLSELYKLRDFLNSRKYIY